MLPPVVLYVTIYEHVCQGERGMWIISVVICGMWIVDMGYVDCGSIAYVDYAVNT
jgi:hypothetical protein